MFRTRLLMIFGVNSGIFEIQHVKFNFEMFARYESAILLRSFSSLWFVRCTFLSSFLLFQRSFMRMFMIQVEFSCFSSSSILYVPVQLSSQINFQWHTTVIKDNWVFPKLQLIGKIWQICLIFLPIIAKLEKRQNVWSPILVLALMLVA